MIHRDLRWVMQKGRQERRGCPISVVLADGLKTFCRGDPRGRPLTLHSTNVHAGRRKGDPYTLHAILGLYAQSETYGTTSPFLPDHQASQGRQEGIPNDARRIVAFSTLPNKRIQPLLLSEIAKQTRMPADKNRRL